MWKIKRDGNQLIITSNGKQTIRKFLTPEQAIVQHDKLVAEHEQELRDRRRLSRAASDPRNPELEQAILDAPEDPTSYAVYADWLQSQGDPRGTLMSLQLADYSPDRDAAANRELAAHRGYLLGALAKHRKHEVFGWQFGYIHTAYLDRVEDARMEDVLEQLLQHASGRFLVHVSIGRRDETVDARLVIDVLERLAPPTLRSLFLHKLGEDLERLWPVVPKLRKLSLVEISARLGSIELPALESLRIVDDELPAEAASAIANARYPMLKRLELVRLTYPDTQHPWIDELIERLDLTALEHLAIDGAIDIGKLVRGLPAMPQLVTLELRDSRMRDAHAIELARHRNRFPRLATVDVASNQLSRTGLAALAGLAKEVVAWGQT